MISGTRGSGEIPIPLPRGSSARILRARLFAAATGEMESADAEDENSA
jgi:hypothetical protein